MFFRELFRSLLSANLFVTGIILTLASVLLFYGSIYLFNYTNLGKRLGFLVTGAATFGWMSITSLLFVVYAPRGPKPDNIEGLWSSSSSSWWHCTNMRRRKNLR